jgi:pyruvate dehydrogenase E1 component
MLRRDAQPRVTIAAMGALVPEALLAADRLADLGIGTDVICVVSADLLFRAVQARKGYGDAPTWILDQVFAPDRATPIVTVADAHPHTLSFLAGIHRVHSIDLGVTEFGQSGALDDVYRYHRLDADSLVEACLDVAQP